MIDVVVLLGAPGSGKSSVGERLNACGYRWREWEATIIERWGSRESFVAVKEEALPVLHREIYEWIAGDVAPAVFETTGLSDAPLLRQLRQSGRAFVVRLDVPEGEALRRIAARNHGRHLSDDLHHNQRVWAAFRDIVVPDSDAGLVIDTSTETIDTAVRMIVAALDEQRASAT